MSEIPAPPPIETNQFPQTESIKPSPTQASKEFLVKGMNNFSDRMGRVIVKNPWLGKMAIAIGGSTLALDIATNATRPLDQTLASAAVLGMGTLMEAARRKLTPPKPPKPPRTFMDEMYDKNYNVAQRFVRRKFNIKGP